MTPDLIRRAIQTHGTKTAAAAALGLPRKTMMGMLDRGTLRDVTAPSGPRRHFIIPDVQAKPGVPLEHLEWAGKYIAEHRPDVIVCIGDFADLESLSHYDKGKKSFEGRRYKSDLAAAHEAMELLMVPIIACEDYHPRLVLTLGNHENRINRAVEDDCKLEGTIGVEDLGYEARGWEVVPYLEVVEIDGVCFSHFFASGVMGRPVCSARALNNKKHQSCVMGHVQRREIDYQYTATGKRITSMFVGTFYQHDEDYLGPQGNAETWRGCWVLNEVQNGVYDEMPISMDYLRRKYSGEPDA